MYFFVYFVYVLLGVFMWNGVNSKCLPRGWSMLRFLISCSVISEFGFVFARIRNGFGGNVFIFEVSFICRETIGAFFHH